QNGLVGIVDTEHAPRKIEFNIIRHISVKGKDAANLTLELELFPKITADELLRMRPSYTELRERYTKIISMRVPLWSPDGLPLALVDSGHPAKAVALFKDIPIDANFLISKGNLWWAIGSVTSDPAYPIRRTLLK